MSEIGNAAGNTYALKIKLSADFTKLSTVKIVVNNMKEELDALENSEEKK